MAGAQVYVFEVHGLHFMGNLDYHLKDACFHGGNGVIFTSLRFDKTLFYEEMLLNSSPWELTFRLLCVLRPVRVQVQGHPWSLQARRRGEVGGADSMRFLMPLGAPGCPGFTAMGLAVTLPCGRHRRSPCLLVHV